MTPLRILHVGAGYRPWRRGGLIAYVEDLMAEQAGRGHDVAYLVAGRYYPFLRRPRLHRWQRGPIPMFEILNSPLFDHGGQPELELGEPRVEALVRQVLADFRPDVVHVQELAGLPSSVIEIVREHGTPVVVTLQDYFTVCPAFKLLDADGAVCLAREVGAECVATIAAEGRPPRLLFDATVRHEIVQRLAPLPVRLRVAIAAVVAPVVAVFTALVHRRPAPRDPAAFQRRRDVNVERLGAADRVLAMSDRVREIHELLGVAPERLETMHLTLSHIERLTPREWRGGPLTFATLGGGESAPKGADLLLDAARRLAADPPAGPYRLLIFGHVAPRVAQAARAIPNVEVRPSYAPDALDGLLDEVDVGIVPSLWEEAWGYVGPEFLAKAIPVLGNAIGGIPEYVEEGRTGWLNRSCSAEELAAVMRRLADGPGEAEELHRRLRAERDAVVLPFARHADEVERVYRELVAAGPVG